MSWHNGRRDLPTKKARSRRSEGPCLCSYGITWCGDMSLLEDIQNAAVDPDSDLGALLRKCKILAANLGSKPLEDWLIWESNGYPADVGVPKYRVWSVELKGHFAGPFGAALNKAPIPKICVPEQLRERFTIFRCRDSVACIEQLLSGDDRGVFNMSIGDLAVVLGENVYDGYNCIHAWGEFGSSRLVEVLNTVRNRVLDFALAIWKEAPEAGNTPPGKSALEPARVTQMFNTTVYGGAASVVGTASDSTISLNINAGDFASLEVFLRNHGVEDDDIAELKGALNAERERPSPTTFGPRVAGWISKMVKKAASGLWKVGVGAAGSLLAQAIGKYYGM